MRKPLPNCLNTIGFREASVCSRAECWHLDVPASGHSGPAPGNMVEEAVRGASSFGFPCPLPPRAGGSGELCSPHTPGPDHLPRQGSEGSPLRNQTGTPTCLVREVCSEIQMQLQTKEWSDE